MSSFAATKDMPVVSPESLIISVELLRMIVITVLRDSKILLLSMWCRAAVSPHHRKLIALSLCVIIQGTRAWPRLDTLVVE